ncbi:hypothetical protein L1987_15521 [Smallanthus sonchifolius]|uniref:Uncharacterized protein n=1 Tax=Smallanthus sonchifolius TaxID=185202 RepID=A0ACB9J828_9ASTR|nr:hypothetical protein L1987_15521 [Smallanthus sonchifolius]
MSISGDDNDIGNMPPRLLCISDFRSWKVRFEQFVSATDENFWTSIFEGYVHPTYDYMGYYDVPKPVTALTKVEKQKFDREMKTRETLTLSLPKEIIHSLGKCPTSRDLWEALKKKGEATSQAFEVLIKEVMEKPSYSQSDSSADLTDSESIRSGESTQSTDTDVMSEESFQTVEDDLSVSDTDAEPVIVDQKSEADDDVFMAHDASSSEVKPEVFSNSETFCSNCISVKDKMMRVMDDNVNLICDMKSMHTVNQKLKDNENVCIERIESLKRDISSLTLKIKEQTYHLDMSFAEIEKRNNDLVEKDKELAESKAEVLRVHRKLESFGISSFLLEHYHNNTEEGMGTSGIGYVPPPFNGKYSVAPEIINNEDLDPKTVLKVNPVTGEDMVYSDESDDEYFDEAKVEGIPKEIKKEDSKVDSNSSRNYTFGSSSNSKRVPYVRDYKDKRTCFHCNEMGHIVVNFPYKNKGKKHVVPEKMKPELKPIEKKFVPSQTPKEVHVGESSSCAAYRVKISYMREYRETRSCFYCGLVGHLRIACPHNVKGNRHVTPEKVRTPGKPYVNPNVVKPRDTPKGNSKSEVSLSRPQRRRRNRRLRKLLEQQEFSQSNQFSNERKCSNTSHFKHKEVNEKKYVWKSKVSVSDSSEQSPKIDVRFDCEWSEVYYFDTDGRPMTTMAWDPISN